MTEHRLANILRAIADGKTVQYQTPTGGAWTDFKPDIHALPTYNLDLAWRVKPKPKVKKWRWVFKDPRGCLLVTSGHYKSVEDLCSQTKGVEPLQPINSTMIEVEEDDE